MSGQKPRFPALVWQTALIAGAVAGCGGSGNDAPRSRRRTSLRGPLLQRRVEPVPDLLDRGAGGPPGGDRLGLATAAAAAVGLGVLRLSGGVRGVAGRVDRLVDPAEPFMGLHESRARVLRVRGGRGAPRRRAHAAVRRRWLRAARRALRLGLGREGDSRAVSGLRAAGSLAVSGRVLERARFARVRVRAARIVGGRPTA